MIASFIYMENSLSGNAIFNSDANIINLCVAFTRTL